MLQITEDMSSDVLIGDSDREQVNGQELLDDLGISSGEINWRKDFTQFEEDDVENLEQLMPLIEENADDIVDEFYTHLQSYSQTVAIMDSSSKPVEALKRSQTEYLKDLGRGEYGLDYYSKRARIGKIHDMLNLGPKIYLGAYSMYYERTADLVAEQVTSNVLEPVGPTTADGPTDDDTVTDANRTQSVVEMAVDDALEQFLSVVKLMTLDQQVAMDTYINSYSNQVEDELEQQRWIAAEIQESIEELKEMSAEIAQTGQEVSNIVIDQSSGMREVSDEVSNLSATVEEVASTAERVETTSKQAETLAENGRVEATDAVSVMESVKTAADEASNDVEELDNRVGEIDEIVAVINNIADQTNLLALNASIEAARAGEAGSGFAVVADEVKTLAEESQEQASRIETMIETIQQETESTVGSLMSATDQIDDGVDRVEAAMSNFEDIVEAVSETSNGIEQVATATDDQAASTEEVASIASEATEQAQEVRDAMEEVVASNERQAEAIHEIQRTVLKMTDDD